ncbi:MAG: potassium channel family protein [Bacteroidales bacterium]|nr:potassium channel family protein [Bacteroidales bacterium]MCD8395557.1 potassium channel family protein [Bacteroidales bacterium]
MATNNDTATASATKPPKATKPPESHKIIYNIFRGAVLILSLLLIVWISYDTFEQIPFLSNHHYMTFQLWVCIIFLADFFVELYLSPDRKHFLRHRWIYFIISIPYLNIVNQWNFHFSAPVYYYLRFIPLLRGAYALAMITGYISRNRAVALLWQYVSILATLTYCMALIFYYEEHGVNHYVHTFWDALYWAAMNMTTVGCYFPPVTAVGKVISVILPISGMLMLPLFTVYITDIVRKHRNAPRIQ